MSSWRASIRGSDIAIAGAVAVLGFAFAAYLLVRAEEAARLSFTKSAQHLLTSLSQTLFVPQEDLKALSSFLEASGNVTRRQFRLLTIPMLRRRLLYALEWLPLVLDSDRAAYEAEARSAGLTDYRFREIGPDGKPREAGRRESYVPIHYMEPPSFLALGFDIASDPMRWATAERARANGQIAASRPFGLLEEAGKPDALPVVAMYSPVFREGDPELETARRSSLRGFAMAIFRVAPLVDIVAADSDTSELGLVLTDPDAPKEPPLAQRPRNASAIPRRSGLKIDFPVTFADRRWSLGVFALPGGFEADKGDAIAAATGGVLAALVGFLAMTSIRTITRLRRQVEKVGPYRLVARLGRGAMGVVWEARHALLRRPTAVKLLAPGTDGERALARFEREVQLTASLTHPSTIAIYDFGRTADKVFYYAMELVRGINLLQLVQLEGPIPAGRVVHLLRQACGALSEAHAAGLIHRDIKPANLMICVCGGIPDFLKVLDFGLVKDIGASDHLHEEVAAADGHGGDAELSQDGSLLGTPLYMAPEGMTDPSSVDARTDIFALGAVGYFLLTGRSPFPGRTAIEVFRSERQGPPLPFSTAAPNPVPTSLESVLLSCLSFRRDERPASAEALDAMLEKCAVRPAWTVEQARAWWRDRGPAALAAARAQREERAELMVVASDSAGS
jgi:CHASE1-domain containing sensor protein